jgi:hypothetical protein
LQGKNGFENHPTSGHVDFFSFPSYKFCSHFVQNGLKI